MSNVAPFHPWTTTRITAEPTPMPTPASKLIQGRPTEAGDNNTTSTGEAFRASMIVVNHISPPPMLSKSDETKM